MKDDRRDLGVYLALSILIPAAIIAAFNMQMVGSRFWEMLSEEWMFIGIQVVLYAAPFLTFLLTNHRSPILWIIQTVLMIAVWVWFATTVVESREQGTGVNIGAVLIMFIGPVVTGVLSFLIYRGVMSARSQ